MCIRDRHHAARPLRPVHLGDVGRHLQPGRRRTRQIPDKARKDRKVYGQMVDEEIEQALPMLRELSGDIRTVKEQVLSLIHILM